MRQHSLTLREICWLIALLALAGCTTTPPLQLIDKRPEPIVFAAPPVEPAPEPRVSVPTPPPPPAITEEEQQVLSLLADLQRILRLPPDEQKREHTAAVQAYNNQKNDLTRVKLALLLSLPTGFQDEPRSLALLDAVVGKTPAATPVKQLAALIAAQIAERLRVLREEQKRVEALQQKLDSLKAIEKKILGRDRASGLGK